MRDQLLRAGLLASVTIMTFDANAQTISYFTPGDIVISTVSNQVSGTAANSANSGGNGLDTASPITLFELNAATTTNGASVVGSLTLPQVSSGTNNAISGEYGSASEGILQQSANGQLLTIMGYGVSANSFNSAINTAISNGYTVNTSNPAIPTAQDAYGTSSLGQTTSLTGQAATTVARVVAAIGTTGQVDTSTAVTGVFNTNNPRSAATVDGSSFYISGQGVTGDGTGGVFLAKDGATTATAINTSNSTPSGTPNGTAAATYGTETRVVEIVNTGSGNTLQVSRDAKAAGTPNDTTDIRTLTDANGNLPTSSTGLQSTRVINPTASGTGSSLGGNTGSINLTASLENGVNNSRVGKFVYLSPEQFFYANATTLYVADSGSPKNGSAGAAALGEGGLQKWSLVGGVWVLDYDLYAGLNLVNNATAGTGANTSGGVTGLFGLTCKVVGGTVQCYATSYGLNELSQSYVYEITDTLSNTDATVGTAETFTTVYTAAMGTDIRGVAFAPVPEPMTLALFGTGLAGLGAVVRRRRKG